MARFESKYFIDGYSLKEYCAKHNYSYSSARNMISSAKKKHPDWTEDEVLKDVKERLKKPKTKYFYGSTSLNKYCKENGIVSSTVRRKYNRALKEQGKDVDEYNIMSESIEAAKRGREKYRIGVFKLGEYCIVHDINKESIISGISRYKKEHPNSGLTDDEIAKIVVDNYQKVNVIYYVGDSTLVDYVTKLGYDPSTVIRKMRVMYPEITRNKRDRIVISGETINTVLAGIKNPNGTIYFIGDTSLREYCKKVYISYTSVVDTINKHPEFTLEEIVLKAISNKEKKQRREDRILLRQQENNKEFVEYYLEKYKIDECQFNLAREHFGVFTSITLIEYFGSIDGSIIKLVKGYLEKTEVTFDEAVILNGLGFNEYAYYVVKKLEGFIINIIKQVEASKKKYKEYREYLEEYIYTLIVDKCYLFTPGGLIAYLQTTMKNRLIKYIQNEKRSEMSLNGLNHVSHDIENTDNRERLDTIRESLKDLTEFELEFIYRRFGFYQPAMELQELQEHFYSDYSLKELEDLELSILEKLQKNENLRKLIM